LRGASATVADARIADGVSALNVELVRQARITHATFGGVAGGQPQLGGTALMCGFYLNELLLNLMAREDPHEICSSITSKPCCAWHRDHPFTLRCFEKHLCRNWLRAVADEAGSDKAIVATQNYRYILEHGAVAETAHTHAEGLLVSGKTLMDMTADDYRDVNTARQSKQLMRMLLDHHLAGKILHTRELMRELQKL
jgi:DNA repair protein RecO (recombination protein O)